MQTLRAFRAFLARVHRNERGAVSLETIMIIGAIAIPILIFLLKYGWPAVQGYFSKGMQNLEDQADKAQNP